MQQCSSVFGLQSFQPINLHHLRHWILQEQRSVLGLPDLLRFLHLQHCLHCSYLAILHWLRPLHDVQWPDHVGSLRSRMQQLLKLQPSSLPDVLLRILPQQCSLHDLYSFKQLHAVLLQCSFHLSQLLPRKQPCQWHLPDLHQQLRYLQRQQHSLLHLLLCRICVDEQQYLR